ncbi:Protein of unknown function DUF868, plant [Dillenia turbinata]|uniref:Uncharacterized protein n=1 Tax=Dillenia turbinata TaxID=194707 RepID=A0AAN8ZHM4_9MAGN
MVQKLHELLVTISVKVFWDFRAAKYSDSFESHSDYYVALVFNEKVILLLGDIKKEAFKGTKARPSIEDASLKKFFHFSLPVRYIPKNLQPKESQTSSQQVVNSKARENYKDAEKLAVELLAARFTPQICLKYCYGFFKKVDFSTCSRGLINDFLYAETFSGSRWSSLSWWPWCIKQFHGSWVHGDKPESLVKLVLVPCYLVSAGGTQHQQQMLSLSKFGARTKTKQAESYSVQLLL